MDHDKLLKRRTTSILIYTIGAVLIFVIGVILFSVVQRDTEFAIAVFGSVVGGFLGALLAAIVVVDMYARTIGLDAGGEEDQ